MEPLTDVEKWIIYGSMAVLVLGFAGLVYRLSKFVPPTLP